MADTMKKQLPPKRSSTLGGSLFTSRLLKNCGLRSRTAWGNYVFLWAYLGYSVMYISRKCFSLSKITFEQETNQSANLLGWIETSFLLSYAVFQVFLPSLSDTYGVRPLLIFSFVGAGLFGVLFAMVSSPGAFIFFWFLEGICHAPTFAVFVKTLSPWFDPQVRGLKMSIWTTSQNVGGFASNYIIPKLCDRGWRFAFSASGLVTAVMGGLLWVFLPEPPSSLPPPQEEPPVVLVKKPKSGSIKFVFTENEQSSSSNSRRVRETEMKRMSAEEASTTTPISPITPISPGEPPHYGSVVGIDTSLRRSQFTAVPVDRLAVMTHGGSQELGRVSMLSSSVRCSRNPISTSEVLAIPPKLSMMDVLWLRNLLLCAVSYLCVKVVRYGLMFWLPYFLTKHFGLDKELASHVAISYDLGGVAGAVLCGVVADNLLGGRRLTTAAIMSLCCSVCMLGFAVLTYKPIVNVDANASYGEALRDPGFLVMIVTMTMAGFFVAGPDSILGATAAGEVCERSGIPDPNAVLSTAAGLVNGIGAFGGTLQSVLIANLYARFGWPTVFLCLCCSGVLSVVALVPSVFEDSRRLAKKKTKIIP